MKIALLLLGFVGILTIAQAELPTAKTTTCNCGWLNKRDFELIEGDRLGKNKYPMIAQIIYLVDQTSLSTGVILTPSHVLTVKTAVENLAKETNKIGVYVGQSTRKPQELCLLYDIVKVHLDSNRPLAIIKLKDKMRFTRLTGPICAPMDDFQFLYMTGDQYASKESKLVGWEMGSSDNFRRTHHVPLTINVNGKEYLAEPFSDYRFENGNTCNKEAGSPILYYDYQIFRHIAVGLIDKPESDCKNLKIHKISSEYKWIDRQIKKDGDFSMCVKQDADYFGFTDD